jgi:hypothetical protein
LKPGENQLKAFHPETPKICSPPKGAISPNGTFFRVVFNNPPTSKDFVIWIDEPENKHRLEDKKKKKDCSAFAVSLFAEEGVERSTEIFLRPMREKAKIREATFLGWARVELDSNSGMIKQRGQNPYHYELWTYVNSKLESVESHKVVPGKVSQSRTGQVTGEHHLAPGRWRER